MSEQMYLRRGTTPTLEFWAVDSDWRDMAVIFVTLNQRNGIRIEHSLNDANALSLSTDGSILYFHLTQNETLKLDPSYKTNVQIRAKDKNGEAIASDIMTLDTKAILKDGEI